MRTSDWKDCDTSDLSRSPNSQVSGDGIIGIVSTIKSVLNGGSSEASSHASSGISVLKGVSNIVCEAAHPGVHVTYGQHKGATNTAFHSTSNLMTGQNKTAEYYDSSVTKAQNNTSQVEKVHVDVTAGNLTQSLNGEITIISAYSVAPASKGNKIYNDNIVSGNIESSSGSEEEIKITSAYSIAASGKDKVGQETADHLTTVGKEEYGREEGNNIYTSHGEQKVTPIPRSPITFVLSQSAKDKMAHEMHMKGDQCVPLGNGVSVSKSEINVAATAPDESAQQIYTRRQSATDNGSNIVLSSKGEVNVPVTTGPPITFVLTEAAKTKITQEMNMKVSVDEVDGKEAHLSKATPVPVTSVIKELVQSKVSVQTTQLLQGQSKVTTNTATPITFVLKDTAKEKGSDQLNKKDAGITKCEKMLNFTIENVRSLRLHTIDDKQRIESVAPATAMHDKADISDDYQDDMDIDTTITDKFERKSRNKHKRKRRSSQVYPIIFSKRKRKRDCVVLQEIYKQNIEFIMSPSPQPVKPKVALLKNTSQITPVVTPMTPVNRRASKADADTPAVKNALKRKAITPMTPVSRSASKADAESPAVKKALKGKALTPMTPVSRSASKADADSPAVKKALKRKAITPTTPVRRSAAKADADSPAVKKALLKRKAITPTTPVRRSASKAAADSPAVKKALKRKTITPMTPVRRSASKKASKRKTITPMTPVRRSASKADADSPAVKKTLKRKSTTPVAKISKKKKVKSAAVKRSTRKKVRTPTAKGSKKIMEVKTVKKGIMKNRTDRTDNPSYQTNQKKKSAISQERRKRKTGESSVTKIPGQKHVRFVDDKSPKRKTVGAGCPASQAKAPACTASGALTAFMKKSPAFMGGALTAFMKRSVQKVEVKEEAQSPPKSENTVKLRGKYNESDRLTIGKYACEHGVASALEKFKVKYELLKYPTVQWFRDKYRLHLATKKNIRKSKIVGCKNALKPAASSTIRSRQIVDKAKKVNTKMCVGREKRQLIKKEKDTFHRDKYQRYTEKEKYKFGKYASEHGDIACARKFMSSGDLRLSSVHRFKLIYEAGLTETKRQAGKASKHDIIEDTKPWLSGSFGSSWMFVKSSQRFQCLICDRLLKQKKHLKYHMMIHTDERPHECSTCGLRTRSKSNMNRHVKRIHPALPM